MTSTLERGRAAHVELPRIHCMPKLDASGVAALLGEYGRRSALRGGNPYRAKAYTRAAENLLALTEPLEDLVAEGRLKEIPGVGDAIADIVTTLYQTGSHPGLEAMRKEFPAGVLEMLAIPGLKPDKVLKLYKTLGIASLAELEEAARGDRIRETKGLGASLQNKILQNIEMVRSGRNRWHMHRAQALLENARRSLQQARPELTRIVEQSKTPDSASVLALGALADLADPASAVLFDRIKDHRDESLRLYANEGIIRRPLRLGASHYDLLYELELEGAYRVKPVDEIVGIHVSCGIPECAQGV